MYSYIYMYSCIYIYIYIYINSVYVSTNIYVFICKYIHIHIYTCIYMNINIYVCIYIYTYTDIYIYVHIHVHICIYQRHYLLSEVNYVVFSKYHWIDFLRVCTCVVMTNARSWAPWWFFLRCHFSGRFTDSIQQPGDFSKCNIHM